MRRRMRLLALSLRKTVPLASTATPNGPLSWVAVPKPFKYPEAPPARVVTTPRGVMTRRRSLALSATKRLPLGAKATLLGAAKSAVMPTPSAQAGAPLPAKVVTTVAGVIFLMKLAAATNTFPTPSTAIPYGRSKVAVVVPTPSAEPLLPVPASVVTAPVGVILRMRLLVLSATYSTPAESKVRPTGPVKRALVPVPST